MTVWLTQAHVRPVAGTLFSGSCVSNPDADKVATSLMIEFEDFNHPAVYPTEPPAVDGAL